jgi:hypothetical protein
MSHVEGGWLFQSADTGVRQHLGEAEYQCIEQFGLSVMLAYG